MGDQNTKLYITYQNGMSEMACIYIWNLFSSLQGHWCAEEVKAIWGYPCQIVQIHFSTIFFQNLIFYVTVLESRESLWVPWESYRPW